MVEASDKPAANRNAVSDSLAQANVQMTKQIQDMIDQEEWSKLLRDCGKRLAKNTKQPFFATLKAYAQLKLQKFVECREMLPEIKPFKQTDPHTVKYLVAIFTEFGENDQATKLLEGVKALHGVKKDIGEILFFAYVREGKILKQQNQSLALYREHETKSSYAEWSIESMFLISKRLKFETKILDIAYLLLLKLMKEPNFKCDRKFISLYVKVLCKQLKYQEALDFLDSKQSFFEEDKHVRQKLEAELYHAMGNPVLTINVYFNLLRANNNAHMYREIWHEYLSVTRIVLHEYATRNKFDFGKEHIAEMVEEDPGQGTSTTQSNFEPIDVESPPLSAIKVLFQSLRGIKRATKQLDVTQKKMKLISEQMQRTSYLAEMEFHYIYALHCHTVNCGENSPFFYLVFEYIDKFYDKSDICEDLRIYLQLFNIHQDAPALAKKIRDRTDNMEVMEKESQDQSSKADANKGKKGSKTATQQPISIRVLRWRIVMHKVTRMLGLYGSEQIPDNNKKIELVNQIFKVFLQAMEYHTSKTERIKAEEKGSYMSSGRQIMTELDENNSEDLLIIAIETLYEVKLYDFSVLNPVNFQIILMCQHGLPYYPESTRLYYWLSKIYAKLGLVVLVEDLSRKHPTAPMSSFEGLSMTKNPKEPVEETKKGAPIEKQEANFDDIQALGALRFSMYTDFGFEKELIELTENYTDFYRDKVNNTKNEIVANFKSRNFDQIHPLLSQNDGVDNAPFQRTIGLGQTMLDLNKNIEDVPAIHTVFNSQFEHIIKACGNEFDEGFITERDPFEIRQQMIAKKIPPFKNCGPIENLGKPRQLIMQDEVIAAPYEEKYMNLKKAQESEKEFKSTKGLVRVFGYKHAKSVKFFAQLMNCLRCCYESKYEQLNIEMNYFLLVKNELSLHFLRNTSNMVQTVKTALRVYAQDDSRKEPQEKIELEILAKLICPKDDKPEEKKDGKPDIFAKIGEKQKEEPKVPKSKAAKETTEKANFERIVEKLLEYNEKINGGREISVLDYLKRIDPLSPFLKQYENQRHLRRAFFEEFKIHSLNYVLLLFESIIRILTTMNREQGMEDMEETAQVADFRKGSKVGPDGKEEERQHYYSKNYKRFLEQRQQRVDKFVTSCIGWSHVLRIVEVIEMAMRDLVYKIVPTKVVVKELKTSTGKVLTKESEYTLTEQKKYVAVGKKTQIDYVFELDLKEDTASMTEEQKAEKDKSDLRKNNVFVLNLDDFNLFKLRSTVFLIQFPMNYTLLMINVWKKILPQQVTSALGFSREDIEQIIQTKQAMRDLSKNTVQHMGSLIQYLSEVKKEQPLKQNFFQINKMPVFKAFKDTFTMSLGVNLHKARIEEMIMSTFERMNEAFDITLDNTLNNIEKRATQMNQMYKGPNYK